MNYLKMAVGDVDGDGYNEHQLNRDTIDKTSIYDYVKWGARAKALIVWNEKTRIREKTYSENLVFY